MEPNDNEDLLRNTIDSSMDMIQVFKAVRNEQGEIIDFIWILNNRTSEKFYGDVIGKSLLTLNPGVVKEGIFEAFKKVVVTGEPNQSVRHYVHEQFDDWFLQSAVKQGDGVATTTKNISDIKKAEEQIKTIKESLQANLDSSLYFIQAFKAVRDKSGKIIDFTWVFTNEQWNRKYGEMIGKSLLSENAGVIETGLFEKFVQVTETGITVDHEQYYSHEQFNEQWFHQTLVKMGDGFVMNTEDITQRKKAEQEKQEKQALLESVLNNTESSIMLLKPVRNTDGKISDFEYVYVNDQTLRSVNREVLIGKRMTAEFPAIKNAQLLQTYILVAETGKSFKGEADITLFGYPVWAQVYAQKFGNEVLVTYFDITERKRTEQQLTDSKELLQTIIDVTTNSIAYYKAIRNDAGIIIDFEFQFQNQQAQQYTLGDCTGQRYSDAYLGIKDTDVFRKYCEVVENGHSLNTEIQLNLRGTDRWFHLMAAKLGDGLVATAMDVTERKQAHEEIISLKDKIAQNAENKYRTLFNFINEGFQLYEVLYDESGKPYDFRYLETNQAFEQQTGLKDVAGKLGSEVMPDIESYWIDYLAEILKSPVPLRTENYNQSTGRWYSVSSFRASSDGRPIIGALFNDITERKEREKQQEFLLKFSDALRTDFGVDNVAIRALELLIGHLQLDRSYITSYYLDENRADLDYQLGNDTVPPLPDHFVLSDYPEAFKAVFDKTFIIEDELQRQGLSEAERRNSGKLGMRAMLAATLRKGDNYPLWSIVAMSSKPRRWTQSEINLVEEVAERTWASLERAKTEEALRKSRKRFKSIANLVPDLLWDSEPDGTTNWYNDRWLQYTGQSFEEAINWGWVEAINHSDRETSAKHYAKAVATGQPLRQEHRIRRKDGAYRWFVVDTAPVKDEHGRVIKIYGAATDIHDRKIAEEALRQSEEKYRTLFNSIDEGFSLLELIFDENGKVIDYWHRDDNPSFERMTGIKDSVNKRMSELVPDLEPQWHHMLEQVYYTGEAIRTEYIVQQLGQWYTCYLSRVGSSGSPFIAAIYDDITERKLQEKQVRKELEDTQLLQQISNHIIDEADPEVFYDVLLDSAMKLMSADFASIQLLDTHQQKLLLLSHKNFHPNSVKHWQVVKAGPGSSCSKVLASGKRILEFDLEHPSFAMNKADHTAFKQSGIRSVQSTPLVSRLGTLIGVMSTHWREPHTPSERELGLFDIVARQVADQFERDSSTAALRASEERYRLKLEQEVRERTSELQESRDQLRSILNTTLVQMSILSAIRNEHGEIVDLEIKAVNRELEKETGRQDLVGKIYAQEYPGIKQTGLFEKIVEAIELGEPRSMEYFYPYEGFQKWFTCMFVKFGDGVVATNMDISARKQAEEERFKNYLLLQQSEAVALMGTWDFDLLTEAFVCQMVCTACSTWKKERR